MASLILLATLFLIQAAAQLCYSSCSWGSSTMAQTSVCLHLQNREGA